MGDGQGDQPPSSTHNVHFCSVHFYSVHLFGVHFFSVHFFRVTSHPHQYTICMSSVCFENHQIEEKLSWQAFSVHFRVVWSVQYACGYFSVQYRWWGASERTHQGSCLEVSSRFIGVEKEAEKGCYCLCTSQPVVKICSLQSTNHSAICTIWVHYTVHNLCNLKTTLPSAQSEIPFWSAQSAPTAHCTICAIWNPLCDLHNLPPLHNLCNLCNLKTTLPSVQSEIKFVICTIWKPLFHLHNLKSTLWSVQSEIHSVICTICLHCTVHNLPPLHNLCNLKSTL